MNLFTHNHSKFFTTLVIALFASVYAIAQAPVWGAGGREGGSSPDGGRKVIALETGEKYIVGRFQNTITIGGTTLTTIAGNDSYLVRYDVNGSVDWVLGLRGQALRENVFGIDVDPFGNVILGGNFEDSLYVGSTPVYSSTSMGASAYMAKISPAGTVMFAQEVANAQITLKMSGLALDDAGQITVAGEFGGNMNIQGIPQATNGGGDVFFAKFDNAGNYQWAKTYGGVEYDESWAMAVTGKGEIYGAIMIANRVDFGPYRVGNNGNMTLVIIHLDKNGAVQEVNGEGGVNNSQSLRHMIVNDNKEVYLAGYFSGNIRLSGNNFNSVGGGRDAIVMQFDSLTRFNWAQPAGGFSSDEINGLSTDMEGNVYVIGNFVSSATFGSTTLTSGSFLGDAFMARYDRNGNLSWATAAGASNFDLAYGYDIFVDANGIGYATGEFTGSLNLSGNSLTSAGNVDLFWGIFCQDAEVEIDATIQGTYCKGSNLDVPFQTFSCFEDANVFYLEISDDAGSFANPDTIGSLAGKVPGTIHGALPQNINSGSGYRVRVISTLPAVTSPDNGIDLVVPNNPVPSLMANGNTTFCLNDSVELRTTSSFNGYVWSNGATSSSIYAAQTGIYEVTVTDIFGCQGTDTIHMTQAPVANPEPVISPAGTIALCNGNPVTLDAGSSFATYSWNTGATASNVTAATPGTYTVTVTNTYGCEGVSTPVNVIASTVPVISQNLDTLVSTAAVSYQWNLNGSPIAGANSQQYVPVASGNYTVTITTTYGCVETSSSFPVVLTSVGSSLDDGTFNVYPNPARDVLNVNLNQNISEEVRISIYDLSGKEIFAQTAFHGNASDWSINVNTFPAGFYILTVNGEQISQRQKFQVAK